MTDITRPYFSNLVRSCLSASSLLFLVASTACSDGSPDRSDAPLQRWTVSPEPSVLIGGDDERDDYLLHRVAGATRLSDGRLVIANAGSSELRFFSDDGTYERAVAGDGDGPGELRGILQLVPQAGDSLLIFSWRPGLTWYGPDGEYARSMPFDIMRSSRVECRIAESMRFLLPDGSLVSVFEDMFGGRGCPPTPEGLWRASGLLVRQTMDPPLFDTLAVLPATEWNSGADYRVFGRSLVVGRATDRIYVSDTGSDTILALGLTGDTLAVIATPFSPEPVPPSARETAVREFTRRDGTVQIGEPYLYPDNYPRVARLLVSNVGNLWVMAYPIRQEPTVSVAFSMNMSFLADPDGARWRVLSPDGALIAQVTTPPGVFPVEIGEDYLLGISRDDLDVESVGLYQLSR